MFSPDGGLPAAPFGLLPDAGPPFSRSGFDGAAAQPLFFPFSAEPEAARDPAPARAWLPPPAGPPAKAEARPGRPCRQPSPEPRAAGCCGPAWPAPPWAGPAAPNAANAALPGPPFPGPAAAFPGPQLCPAALQPGSGGLSGLGSSGSSSGAASEGGHSSDSGDEVRSDGTGTGCSPALRPGNPGARHPSEVQRFPPCPGAAAEAGAGAGLAAVPPRRGGEPLWPPRLSPALPGQRQPGAPPVPSCRGQSWLGAGARPGRVRRSARGAPREGRFGLRRVFSGIW